MSCFTRYRTPVVMPAVWNNVALKAQSLEILLEGLRSIQGISYLRRVDPNQVEFVYAGQRCRVTAGKLDTTLGAAQAADLANAINRAYAGKVVEKVAARKGWRIQEDQSAIPNQRKLRLVR